MSLFILRYMSFASVFVLLKRALYTDWEKITLRSSVFYFYPSVRNLSRTHIFGMFLHITYEAGTTVCQNDEKSMYHYMNDMKPIWISALKKQLRNSGFSCAKIQWIWHIRSMMRSLRISQISVCLKRIKNTSSIEF